jgi:3-methyladenine DNA glycosylase AlkD
MQLEQAMQELEQGGSAQTCKTYRRHGVQEPLFGVLTSHIEKLRKQIKVDHELALALWESGNHDARILATKIADANCTTSEQLERWSADLTNYVISDAFAAYVARTPLAHEQMVAWTPRAEEWIGSTGWLLLAHLANQDQQMTDEDFVPYLGIIRREIHQRANRIRYAMNAALIAIGLRSPALQSQALAIAAQIGVVDVDHGDTNCKTPDATSYIEKAAARKVAA